ncbi:MAG: hypothetical protein RBS24_00610 [Bacilli bacterium]|nr:hypothetical protein [Bacilli bacterium]
MNTDQAVNFLKQSIKTAFDDTKKKLQVNVFRGHSRSISTDIEDLITLFIAKVLPENYKFLLDASIHVNGKNNRPDLLIANQNNEVIAMIELKSNMGYCRDATNTINEIIENHNKFLNFNDLTCKFSDDDQQTVSYNQNVELFLVSLTSNNCSTENHQNNKIYAASKGVHYFNLFSGWYGELIDNDVIEFLNTLIN